MKYILQVIDFCNQNNGFLSAVLSVVSALMALIAIYISVLTARRQEKLSLYDKRIELYTHIKKICLFLDRFPVSAQKGNYDALAKCFVYQVGSSEAKQFDQIVSIKKRINMEQDKREQEKLEHRLRQEVDKMFSFCVQEMNMNNDVTNGVHFLFDEDIEKRVKRIVDLYEAFVLGHPVFWDEDYEKFIRDVADVKKKYDVDTLLRDIEKKIWKAS